PGGRSMPGHACGKTSKAHRIREVFRCTGKKRAPAGPGQREPRAGNQDIYLTAVWMLVNVVFRPLPTVPTTVTMATEMPAAMRPYSMAVAPDSSSQKRA